MYSKLAAITAASTEEISTAMTKTASIAHAANMEFETTAAFLSQIIETTRESAETAGTALKTVIARFTEVKKLYDSGEIEGVDEEGEIIDVNKVSAALRKVGISMKAFFAGEEGLDSIFLKLAEKWDSLDTITQRYIATMAAGSRQQSRFLAMMGDYGRTMELVEAANNSAGAGTEQFEKTLDSIETKLTRLKNAWDEFLMGLANNELIGMFIDLLTNIVSTVNTLTNALSGGNGLIKSLLTLGLTISSLRIGGKLFNKIFDKGLVNIGSKLFGTEKDIQEQGKKMSSSFISSFFKAIKDSKGSSGKDFLSNLFTTEETEEVARANAELITKTFHSELEAATKSMPDSDYVRAHIEDAFRLTVLRPPVQSETYGITLDKQSCCRKIWLKRND